MVSGIFPHSLIIALLWATGPGGRGGSKGRLRTEQSAIFLHMAQLLVP